MRIERQDGTVQIIDYDFEANRKKIRGAKQAYYDAHKCCPKCGNDSQCQTYIGFIFHLGEPFADENRFDCSCGHSGIVGGLVAGL